MRKSAATGLAILLVILGVANVAQAQNWIQVQGRIQAVDCQANAVVLNAPDGTHVFPMAPNASVFINSAPTSFCTLRQYIGGSATVSVTAAGNQMVAGRVDVYTTAAPVQPAPAPSYGYNGPSSGSPYYGAPYYGGPYSGGPYSGGPYYGGTYYGGTYYGRPYCYNPYYGGPYYGGPYCYGPYSGYYPYYGPSFGFGIGIVFGPGFHRGDRDRRFVDIPRFRERHFVVGPGFRNGGRNRR
jgi:hypothetical protein